MRYKALSLVLTNRLTISYIQQLISYICYLIQLKRKFLQIKVKYILDDCLLFSRSKLLAIQASLSAQSSSAKLIREPLVFYVKSYCSILQALKLFASICLKSKINSTLLININYVILLRHYLRKEEFVVLRNSSQFSSVASLGVEYVIDNSKIIIQIAFLNKVEV